jgi:hypothetical protein
MDGNKEILCMYRQFDGYLSGHGVDLLNAFKGFRITNGISGDAKKTANGMGCLAAQVVAHFKKTSGTNDYNNGAGLQVGGFYLYAPETREVGEEFIYRLSEKSGRIWLDVSEGEVAWFGLPGTKPELMDWIYSGYLDNFKPTHDNGEIYHKRTPRRAAQPPTCIPSRGNAMTTKHTPGPWNAMPFGPNGGARVYGPDFRPLPDTWENAYLLAAAPDLLEAVRELVTSFKERPPLISMAEREALDHGLAAIARAEGRTL